MNVSHVINYEMPAFIADYVHRVGRVGRLNNNGGGGKKAVTTDGLITNFVTKKFEVNMVANIERSIRLGVELENVNANIKRFYKYLHDEQDEGNGRFAHKFREASGESEERMEAMTGK